MHTTITGTALLMKVCLCKAHLNMQHFGLSGAVAGSCLRAECLTLAALRHSPTVCLPGHVRRAQTVARIACDIMQRTRQRRKSNNSPTTSMHSPCLVHPDCQSAGPHMLTADLLGSPP